MFESGRAEFNFHLPIKVIAKIHCSRPAVPVENERMAAREGGASGAQRRNYRARRHAVDVVPVLCAVKRRKRRNYGKRWHAGMRARVALPAHSAGTIVNYSDVGTYEKPQSDCSHVSMSC